MLVVNTCSFIDPAKQESIDTILEMAEYKKSGRARKLIVAGCLVERYRDQIRGQLPEVDALVGTNELAKIVAVCEGLEADASPLEPYLYHDLTPRVLSTASHFAYIKIAEGCDHPCSFCVIPQYRGKFRSRRFESVIAEATRLFAQGVREINLIGQDTTSYGEDLGIKDGLAQFDGAAGADRDRARKVDPVSVLLSEPDHAKAAGHHRRARRVGEIHRHAAAARQRQRAEAHEARIAWRFLPEAAGAHSRDHSRRRDSDQHDRRLSRARPRRISRSCAISSRPRNSTGWACSPTPTKTRARAFIWTPRWTARTIHNRKRKLMAVQRRISKARNRKMIGREVDVLIEGPSRRYRSAVAGAHVHAGARNRRRSAT